VLVPMFSIESQEEEVMGEAAVIFRRSVGFFCAKYSKKMTLYRHF
jgi:hypothetical protein